MCLLLEILQKFGGKLFLLLTLQAFLGVIDDLLLGVLQEERYRLLCPAVLYLRKHGDNTRLLESLAALGYLERIVDEMIELRIETLRRERKTTSYWTRFAERAAYCSKDLC